MRTPDTPARPEDSSSYLARRRRNNEAARRCRERRRLEELLLELRAMELLQENQRLRAALCALYPGPRVTDWPERSFPVPPGLPEAPHRADTVPPAPPAANTLHPGWGMPPPSQAAGGPSGAAAATADSSPRTLSKLPHKLRLKGARGWGEPPGEQLVSPHL